MHKLLRQALNVVNKNVQDKAQKVKSTTLNGVWTSPYPSPSPTKIIHRWIEIVLVRERARERSWGPVSPDHA